MRQGARGFDYRASLGLDFSNQTGQHDYIPSAVEVTVTRKTVSVAEAKKHLSELLGRVDYGGEQIVIAKRGKPLARLVPATEESEHLADARGWLDNEDDFFKIIDHIIEDRHKHIPRAIGGQLVE